MEEQSIEAAIGRIESTLERNSGVLSDVSKRVADLETLQAMREGRELENARLARVGRWAMSVVVALTGIGVAVWTTVKNGGG